MNQSNFLPMSPTMQGSDAVPSHRELLAAGKPPKVALVAIMRKLLILANALLRDRRTLTPKLA